MPTTFFPAWDGGGGGGLEGAVYWGDYTLMKRKNLDERRSYTSKHSSRMRTTQMCQPYVLQWPSDASTMGGSEVNKFEQVSSDAHQMLLVGK